MRPLPIVAGGASGGLAGLCFQVLREISSGVPLSPPEPELSFLPSASTETSSISSFFERVHLPSLIIGLALGLLLGPLLDLAFLLLRVASGIPRGCFPLNFTGFLNEWRASRCRDLFTSPGARCC